MSSLALPSLIDKISGKRVFVPIPAGAEVVSLKTSDHALWGSAAARALGLTLLPTLAEGRTVWAEGVDLDQLRTEAEMLLGAIERVVQETGYEEAYVRNRAAHVLEAARQALEMGGEVIIW